MRWSGASSYEAPCKKGVSESFQKKGKEMIERDCKGTSFLPYRKLERRRPRTRARKRPGGWERKARG
eukprot:5333449-Pleurochrysis_carterae.AAC.1